MLKRRLQLLLCVAITGMAMAFAQMGQPGGQGGMQQPSGMQRPGGQLGKNMPDDQDLNAQPQVPKVDDATLDREVHEQLTKHAELAGVTATVKDGVVQLTGTVASKADKKEAHKLVNAVKGVRDVKDKLTMTANGSSAAAKPM